MVRHTVMECDWPGSGHSVEAMGGGWSSESGDSRKLSTYLPWQFRESGRG